MWKVYVGNLDSRITERELADEFRVYGVVRSVWVARNPPGYAFIEFDDRRDANDAITALDGKNGWRVEMSRNYGSGRNRGRNSSESRCYECGGSGHFARECRSGGSRNSHRRSPSPHARTGSRRKSPPRNARDYSRSPGRNRKSSYTNGSNIEEDRWGYNSR
eukprot:TRINITY_DN23947_c0_g1_i1.p1 TRINITY_DN23947_c0_g1~~TRINITY_DN23947_c0_g1_i1.p1  ORF type:complete len:162 (+),score=20.10 TRINITY_DN23947_c0_g1_i1:145-630(+)